MTTRDLMTKDLATCTPHTTAAEAASLMWNHDCGFLPVIEDGILQGVVTDRDLFIALATRDDRPSDLRVGAVMSGTPVSCAPEDDLHAALFLMRQAQVRRLPVVGAGGAVEGVLALTDIILGGGLEVGRDDVIEALRDIGFRHPGLRVAAA
jgi:CBS domain-containing protein